MNPTDSATVIGRSMKFRGELSGVDDLRIDGEVEGTIHLPGGRLVVGPEGRVRATLVARDIVIAGKVQGEILATGSVQLRSTAVVLGDIAALRFSMEENAVLRGMVDPGRTATLAAQAAMDPVVTQMPLAIPDHEASANGAAAHEAPAVIVYSESAHEPIPAVEPAEASHGHLPAALAAAERHFEEAVATGGHAATTERNANSGDSPELAETQV
jgi:cytoskeletal protein CcmA (bactofilin family)